MYLQSAHSAVCDASQWRRTWSRTTANGSSATRVFHSGIPVVPLRSSTRYPGSPLPLCFYVTRGLVVVDRTLCACLVTCSSRHLTSHLSHSYISTTHSLRPQGLCYSFPCVFSVSTGYEPGVLRRRESYWHLNSYTNRLRPRLTHVLFEVLRIAGT